MCKNLCLSFALLILSLPLLAAEKTPSSPEAKVDLQSIQEKYTDESTTMVEVVQNSRYTKNSKFELSLLGGYIQTDPFLNVKSIATQLGYHFNETFALEGIYWKDMVGSSDALTTFEKTNGFTVNTNKPKSFLGGDLVFSPIYGKFSIFSSSIVYVDLHLLAGGGIRSTESGNFTTLFAGVGQQIYLSRLFTLRLDYRLIRFKETLLEKVVQSQLGANLGERTRWDGMVTLGVSFLFNPF